MGKIVIIPILLKWFVKMDYILKKASLQGHMITTGSIKKSNFWIILLFVLFSGGCRPSSTSVKELISSNLFSELYVSIQCTQIEGGDTMIICYPYIDLVYSLEEDSSTKDLSCNIADYVFNGKIMTLPQGHFLLQQVVFHNTSVDSIYALGYKRLLQEYFFCHNELDKEKCCCLDWLHSACGNSVYFGHRNTPCYYKEGDKIMDDNKQYYIISLLYKHNIYCILDENGNVCLLNCNLN